MTVPRESIYASPHETQFGHKLPVADRGICTSACPEPFIKEPFARIGAATVGATVALANTAATTSNAYYPGYVTGATTAAPAPTHISTAFAMGAVYAALPTGCISPSVRGGTYYLCGNTWFQPAYGANGVYYRVVPLP